MTQESGTQEIISGTLIENSFLDTLKSYNKTIKYICDVMYINYVNLNIYLTD